MCKVNDIILYGSRGICEITQIAELNMSGTSQNYYILKPVENRDSTIYVPVDNEALKSKMRQVLSADEIHKLIQSMPTEDSIWIENESERKEVYRKMIARGDRTELIQIIKTLYVHQQEQKEKGKKLHVSDEQYLKEAEKLLYDEFALVLNMRVDQVLPFIMEQIELQEKD
ncbi:CarD family transcriptional regulator [Anaerolentibacter hominis]|uniref:CarD family transcriptional regulator n=1 Tax=Anaerolentibacter hominis TaxID=3079009 RepID=UPI0031B8A457